MLRGAPDRNALVPGASSTSTYSTPALFAPLDFPTGSTVDNIEAAAVITSLILLGRFLKARTQGRTGTAFERLMRLLPDIARVERKVPWPIFFARDFVRLRPDERIPMDRTVRNGSSWADESMITKEPANRLSAAL